MVERRRGFLYLRVLRELERRGLDSNEIAVLGSLPHRYLFESGVLAEMRERGLIDRREEVWVITDKGREVLREIMDRLRRDEEWRLVTLCLICLKMELEEIRVRDYSAEDYGTSFSARVFRASSSTRRRRGMKCERCGRRPLIVVQIPWRILEEGKLVRREMLRD